MRRRIIGIVLAVTTLLLLTPETALAARMETKTSQLMETAVQVEPEAEAEPEAKIEQKMETEPKVKTAGGVSILEGDGTKTAPYRIGSAEQLCAFAELVNGVNGAPVTEACASLVHDIDLSGICGPKTGSWTPIGTSENPYIGSFDGSAFVITGLYCNKSGASYAGLFGCNAGTIKNVGIVGADITAGNYTGGVCGYNKGIIAGCYHEASVKGANYTGGVCGYNDGGGTVSVCYNTGTVSGRKYVGGICGYNKNIASDCYNMGPVTGEKTSIGGICGYNKASVANCFNTGSVVGGGENYVGSICGYNHSKSTFSNCYYLITGEEKANYGAAMSTERFASGEVCWLLNGGKSENVIWFQTCGHGFPTFGGKTVYQVQQHKTGGRADEMVVAYSNEKEKKQAAAKNVMDKEDGSKQNSGDTAHKHHYQEPEWEWDEYKAAAAVFTCQDCGENLTLEAVISKSIKAATCAKEGETIYKATVDRDGDIYEDIKTTRIKKTAHRPLEQVAEKSATCKKSGISQPCWTCPACGIYFTDEAGTEEIPKKQVVIPALGHSYPEPQWDWHLDHNPVTVTATFVCERSCGMTEPMEAKVTSETTASCTTAGETTYTAVVKFNNKTYTETNTVKGQPLPHSYGKLVWEWEEDYSKATATFSCTKCTHQEQVYAVPTAETTDPTCKQEGEITYTAEVRFGGREYSDVKRKALAKTDHSYSGEPAWTWSNDFSKATATFICDFCETSTDVGAVVTPQSIPGVDCGTPGKTIYTAVATVQDKTYTEVREKVMPATHTLTHTAAQAATCEGEGNKEYWQCNVCHKLFADVKETQEIEKIPVIPAAGHKLDHVEDKKYICTVCGRLCIVDVAPDGTKSIYSLEDDIVVIEEAPAQSDEEEQADIKPQSDEEEQTDIKPQSDEEEQTDIKPQSDEEEQTDAKPQSVEGQDGESEAAPGREAPSPDREETREENAARYGLIYPESEGEEADLVSADAWDERAVNLRAESSGHTASQPVREQQGSSLWGAAAVLSALAGFILIMLCRGKRRESGK